MINFPFREVLVSLMRGVKNRPETVEKAVQLYAIEGSYTEVGRQLGIARQTATDLIDHGVEFSEFRQRIEQGYIVEAWNTVTAAHRALHDQLSNSEYVGKLTAIELSQIISQLHKTVTNVANHIVAVQTVMVTDTPDDLEREAYAYIGLQYGLTVEQVKEKLTKV